MNPYAALGVPKNASTDEIKKAYRKLAREHHPDLNPGDQKAETRFKEVSVAYDILSDEKKRADFDEFGEISLQAGFDADKARAAGARFGGPGGPGGGAPGGGFEFANLEDLFANLGGFGGGGGARQGLRRKGGDLESAVHLDFRDAVRGGERKFTVERLAANGQPFSDEITVRIPPGVTDGGKLRIPGKGRMGGGGGPPGDLWLKVHVRADPVFRQQGRDLEFDLPLTIAEAVNGAKIEVPTLDERVVLSVPPGTSSHARLRLKGKGVPATARQPAGDLYARIKIVVPSEASEALREALGDEAQPDPRADLPWR